MTVGNTLGTPLVPDLLWNYNANVVVAPVTAPLGHQSAECLPRITSGREKLYYIRPDGVKYLLHAPPGRVLMSEEGLGTPPMEYVSDQAPFQHGDTVRSFTLGVRPIQLVILQNFTSRAAYRQGRASLLDTIRPNRITNFNTQGLLRYHLADGSKREIPVVLESGPGFAPPEGGWRGWSFTEVLRFAAHDPVWRDPAINTISFVETDEDLLFPATFPIKFGGFGGVIAGLAYPGTWEEYPSFTITGPITAPSIENVTTGDKITLSYILPAGYTITITLRGQKSIVLSDGTNLLNKLTPDSDLVSFSLQPDPIAPLGVNELRVTGTGTSPATSVTMSWYNRYFGV